MYRTTERYEPMNAAQEQTPEQSRLRLLQHGAIFLTACAVMIARRPDAVFHAQFYVEDGHVWFAEAYNLGWWHALFRTYNGYFQTLPRLGAALALLVPLSLAPLVLNLIAITVQALPVNLLLNSRSSAWGSLRFRALLAALYLALPNCQDMSVTITESQWLLALSAFLILVSAPPRNVTGWFLDVVIVLLCGLTGPFCVLLLPIAIFRLWKGTDRRQWASVAVLSLACLAQAWGRLVIDRAGRHRSQLGVRPELFVRILSGKIYLGTLLGASQLSIFPGLRFFTFLISVTIVGTAIVSICFAISNAEMKLFLLFSAAIFALSLASPVTFAPHGLPEWLALAIAPTVRYWALPTLAFA